MQRIADAFAAARGKRAALMPYLMGGFPTLAESPRIGEACIDGGADVIELGVPYSDPLADGPVIHAAGTRALAAGANVAGVLEVARALAASVPVVLMCYANMVFAPGVEAFVERLARSGRVRADRPRPALTARPRRCGAACDAARPRARRRWSRRRRRRSASRRSARSAQGFLYTVSVVGTTGERDALGDALRARSSRRRRRRRGFRSRSASASARPSRPPRRPTPAPTA